MRIFSRFSEYTKIQLRRKTTRDINKAEGNLESLRTSEPKQTIFQSSKKNLNYRTKNRPHTKKYPNSSNESRGNNYQDVLTGSVKYCGCFQSTKSDPSSYKTNKHWLFSFFKLNVHQKTSYFFINDSVDNCKLAEKHWTLKSANSFITLASFWTEEIQSVSFYFSLFQTHIPPNYQLDFLCKRCQWRLIHWWTTIKQKNFRFGSCKWNSDWPNNPRVAISSEFPRTPN